MLIELHIIYNSNKLGVVIMYLHLSSKLVVSIKLLLYSIFFFFFRTTEKKMYATKVIAIHAQEMQLQEVL